MVFDIGPRMFQNYSASFWHSIQKTTTRKHFRKPTERLIKLLSNTFCDKLKSGEYSTYFYSSYTIRFATISESKNILSAKNTFCSLLVFFGLPFLKYYPV